METDKRAYALYRKIVSAPKDSPYFANAADVFDARISSNQFGTYYKFPDGSKLDIMRRDAAGWNTLRCFIGETMVAIASCVTPIEPRQLEK